MPVSGGRKARRTESADPLALSVVDEAFARFGLLDADAADAAAAAPTACGYNSRIGARMPCGAIVSYGTSGVDEHGYVCTTKPIRALDPTGSGSDGSVLPRLTTK